jgi:hypothetical protein
MFVSGAYEVNGKSKWYTGSCLTCNSGAGLSPSVLRLQIGLLYLLLVTDGVWSNGRIVNGRGKHGAGEA